MHYATSRGSLTEQIGGGGQGMILQNATKERERDDHDESEEM